MIAASLIEYRNKIAPIDSVQPFHSNHLLSVASQNAVRSQNLPALLRHGDRNSMRWGVESRQPYLTPKLVEFCWSLPSKYHVSDTGLTKNVLRHAFIKIVPDEILYRKDKIGFQAPWLSETTTKFLLQDSQTLLEEIGHIFLFNRTYMSSPKAPKFVQWRFINFMQWLKIYGIKL
jgi:asparagine synthase (glutamine-hydrolysing)